METGSAGTHHVIHVEDDGFIGHGFNLSWGGPHLRAKLLPLRGGAQEEAADGAGCCSDLGGLRLCGSGGSITSGPAVRGGGGARARGMMERLRGRPPGP